MTIEVTHAAWDRAWENALPYLESRLPVVILEELSDKLDDYRISVEQEIAMLELRATSAEEEAQAMAIAVTEAEEKMGACGRG